MGLTLSFLLSLLGPHLILRDKEGKKKGGREKRCVENR
jgi:hypothetical protein